MKETKFNIYGEMIRPNGHQQYDILSYIAETREEAIATCKRLHPHFHIIGIKVDESVPEVVRMQPLRWHREAAARVRSGKWHTKDARSPRPCIL